MGVVEMKVIVNFRSLFDDVDLSELAAGCRALPRLGRDANVRWIPP